MPLYRFDTVLGMGTQMAGGTVDTDAGVTFVLPVSLPVGGAVGQYLVLRAEHAVIVLVIHILPPLVAAFHGLGPFVGGGQYSAVAKYFLTDMRGLVGGIGHNGLYFRKCLCHTVIYVIESHTVMYIAGGNDGLQEKAILVTGGMGLILSLLHI